MFTCETCGSRFSVAPSALERYPGWQPKKCLDCRNQAMPAGSSPTKGSAKRSVTKNRDLTTAEVLAGFSDGPLSGIFTDGASEGNPGPGGWGAVYVMDDRIVMEDHGSEPHTTNNRMELTAMIAGLEMAPSGRAVEIYTDSQLVVNTLTQWAAGWEANGWRKKSAGPIANLELVKEAFALFKRKPGVRLSWVPAHSGYRWNEYADALATAYRRDIF